MKHIRIEAATPGHKVMLDHVGDMLECYCVCGWASYAQSTERAVVRRGAEHLERVAESIEIKAPQEWRVIELSRGESLSQALTHIDRCNLCGTWQWDNDCTTCMKLHQRTNKQKAAA